MSVLRKLTVLGPPPFQKASADTQSQVAPLPNTEVPTPATSIREPIRDPIREPIRDLIPERTEDYAQGMLASAPDAATFQPKSREVAHAVSKAPTKSSKSSAASSFFTTLSASWSEFSRGNIRSTHTMLIGIAAFFCGLLLGLTIAG